MDKETTMDVNFICVDKWNFDEHSRALAAASNPQRAYSLFEDCHPNCPSLHGDTLHPVPHWWSVIFLVMLVILYFIRSCVCRLCM